MPTSHSVLDPIKDSAIEGYKSWKKLSYDQRANYLVKYREAVTRRKEEIAEAIAWEVGKPLWEARTEAGALAAKVNVTLGDSLKRIEDKLYPDIMANTQGLVTNRPIGPCLVIGPFNFPCHLANGQILSALLAGNSVIFKPTGRALYCGQLMLECFDEAGFPPGVINLINGRGNVATELMKEKEIKGIFFTGSTGVGRHIMQTTHGDFNKMVALEMGGKNCSIVHSDANTKQALAELIKACFLTTGQRCTSTSIIAIHRSLQNQFIEQFHQVAKRIIVDHPVEWQREPFMGPLVDQNAKQSYLDFMQLGAKEGAEAIMPGVSLELKHPGHYVSPSIHLLEKPQFDGSFFKEEIFGPNCTFVPYDTIEEAIAINNAGDYGLAAGVFTADDEVFSKCLSELENGVINRNRSSVGANSRLPFGGVKNSGNYRPAAVATIDACVHPVACLQVPANEDGDLSGIVGLE
ncbi:MAG: aldehyde dehydrogenase family protein [Halobacteriovoraceae bacterium]|nr:aldehyde dehydrogenase family protein [Halobacteriovoraceae bacterium]